MMLYSSFSLWRAWKRTTRDKNPTNTAMTHDTLLNNMTRWRVTHRKTMTRWRVTRRKNYDAVTHDASQKLWRGDAWYVVKHDDAVTRDASQNYDTVTHDTLLNTMTRWRVTHHKTMTRTKLWQLHLFNPDELRCTSVLNCTSYNRILEKLNSQEHAINSMLKLELAQVWCRNSHKQVYFPCLFDNSH